MTHDRLVLGVDPSFNRTGWALMEPRSATLLAYGVIAPRGGDRAANLFHIQWQFKRVLQTWLPGAAYFERPGTWQRRGGTRRETLEVMAMARGVMLAACAELAVPAFEIDFQVARRALLGRRKITVTSVVDFVRSLGFDLPVRPRGSTDFDIVNAILIGIYGLSCQPPRALALLENA